MLPVNIAVKHKTQEDILKNRKVRQRKDQDTLSFSVSQKTNIIIDRQKYFDKNATSVSFYNE